MTVLYQDTSLARVLFFWPPKADRIDIIQGETEGRFKKGSELDFSTANQVVGMVIRDETDVFPRAASTGQLVDVLVAVGDTESGELTAREIIARLPRPTIIELATRAFGMWADRSDEDIDGFVARGRMRWAERVRRLYDER